MIFKSKMNQFVVIDLSLLSSFPDSACCDSRRRQKRERAIPGKWESWVLGKHDDGYGGVFAVVAAAVVFVVVRARALIEREREGSEDDLTAVTDPRNVGRQQ